MSRLWWQLPGPSGFVSRVVQDLRDGKNTIFCLPEHSPDGLANAVRSALGDGEEWSWHTCGVQEEDDIADPARFLFARFVPEARPDALWNAGTLVESEAFAGKLIWLEGLTAKAWSAWKVFIEDYQHACRSRSPFGRTLFCVPLVGELALDPPIEDVCLSHHYWRGAVDLLDMFIFSANLLQAKQIPHLQKRVAVSLLGHLALWDPAVSERLAPESLDRIFNPVPLLQEIARERGWNDHNALPSCAWHQGMSDIVDGEEKIHSAILAFDDSASAITQRVWSAEVGVLLPFVEERRQDLLTRLASVLQVPFKTRFGEVITDLRDLEIGHIESQIVSNGRAVATETRQLVRRLREIRNSLSHLEPLSLELLLCDEIRRVHTGENAGDSLNLARLKRWHTQKKE